jgi:hypothetical protein
MYSTNFEKVRPPHTASGCASFSWARAGHLVPTIGPRIAHQYVLLYKKRSVLRTCKRGPHDSSHVSIMADVLAEIPARVDTDTLVNPLRPLVHVGRLDLESSEGLILLTNDGSFFRACTSIRWSSKDESNAGLVERKTKMADTTRREEWPRRFPPRIVEQDFHGRIAKLAVRDYRSRAV